MRKILIILFTAMILVGCSSNTWQGFYYPNGCLSCESDYIYSPIYKTKEECFDWAYSLKDERGNPSDLFECGKNCKDNGYYNVCEETID